MEYQGKITTQHTLSKKISRTENDLEFVQRPWVKLFATILALFSKKTSPKISKKMDS